MTPTTTPDALRAYLRGQGTDPEMIERHVARLGAAPTVATRVLGSRADLSRLTGSQIAALVENENAAQRVSRGTIVLPWSCLVSDNRHRGPVSSRADHRAYKAARTKAHEAAAEQWGDAAPFAGPVAVMIRLTPPNHARRDIANFAKCLLDALAGVAYRDDSQIAELTIRRAAVDVDRPRADITVEAIDTCS